MNDLVPVAVVLPFLLALTIAAIPSLISHRIADLIAMGGAVATTVVGVFILTDAVDERLVYWFGDWVPRDGFPIGISFAVDGLSAGLNVLVGLLAAAAFLFSQHYFADTQEHRFHILMLLFMGAMSGFVMSGDLFNMFVFFELMGVIAFSLTGYKVEEPASIQGGINFAVTNTIGGLTLLLGTGLLYARTETLNLAEIGEALAGRSIDGLVIAAFTLILVGLFVKAAVVPFHFWLADAHAIAPTPVCVLFSGIMVIIGLYGAARVFWTAFSGAFAVQTPSLGNVLMAAGALTAIVGATMCFTQQHLKRMLAFSTVTHVGLFVIGLGLLEHVALAGTALYIVSHGLIKGSLFMCAGIVLHRLGMVDEEALRGQGRALRWTAALFAVGALALAGLPPFGTHVGKALVEEAATKLGHSWVTPLFVLTSALASAAILRACGRIFLGWGPDEPDRFAADRFGEEEEEPETTEARDHTPVTMFVAPVVLLVGGLAVGLFPGFAHGTERAAASFEDRAGYAREVLMGEEVPLPRAPITSPTTKSVFYGLLSAGAACVIAFGALFRKRIPDRMRQWASSSAGTTIFRLRTLHSGHIGDYVAWIALGLAVYGGLFTLVLR